MDEWTEFRYRDRVCQVLYGADAFGTVGWWALVSGDSQPRGPFGSSGQAIEAAIAGASIRERRKRRKR